MHDIRLVFVHDWQKYIETIIAAVVAGTFFEYFVWTVAGPGSSRGLTNGPRSAQRHLPWLPGGCAAAGRYKLGSSTPRRFKFNSTTIGVIWFADRSIVALRDTLPLPVTRLA